MFYHDDIHRLRLNSYRPRPGISEVIELEQKQNCFIDSNFIIGRKFPYMLGYALNMQTQFHQSRLPEKR